MRQRGHRHCGAERRHGARQGHNGRAASARGAHNQPPRGYTGIPPPLRQGLPRRASEPAALRAGSRSRAVAAPRTLLRVSGAREGLLRRGSACRRTICAQALRLGSESRDHGCCMGGEESEESEDGFGGGLGVGLGDNSVELSTLHIRSLALLQSSSSSWGLTVLVSFGCAPAQQRQRQCGTVCRVRAAG